MIKKINPKHLLYGFCILQLITWSILSSIIRNNIPFDTIEGIAWGFQWQLGYDKHPPLAAWLSALFTNVGGVTGFPVYFLAQLAVITTFWAIWRLANKFLSPINSLISTLLLTGIIYYADPAITEKFNPTTLMSPIWALLILAFYNALTTGKTHYWLITGFIAGLSILTKYQSALLLFSMLILILTTEKGRASIKTFGPYLASVTFLVTIFPNIWWLAKNSFSEINYATDSLIKYQLKPAILNHFYFPFTFLFSQVFAHVAFFVLCIPLFLAKKTKHKIENFKIRFLLILGFGPFALTLLLSIFTGCYLYAKWATPYFILNGILLMVYLQPIITSNVLKKFIIILFSIFLLFIATRIAYLTIGPNILKIQHIADAYYPGKNIANSLTKKWHDRYHKPLSYIVGDHYLIANITAYSKDRPIPYFDLNKIQSPWIDENILQKKGALLVWKIIDSNARIPKYFHERFPNAKHTEVETFAQDHKNLPPIKIGIAFLPPNSSAK